MVAADDGVDSSVELDAGHFGPGEQSADVDIVDGVARDGAEHGTHAADDSRLLAVRNVVVANDVVADVLLRPAVFQGALNRFDVAPGSVLRRIVKLVTVLAERDARADGVANVVVLDDPSLAPVGADQADLLGGGWRPGRGRVLHRKAAYGDVIDARFLRIEHCLADVDLHLGFVRIDILELRPDRGGCLVHFPEPQRGVPDGFQHVIQLGRFGEPVAVQINGARVMVPSLGTEPVAVNQVAVWVEVSKKAVGDADFPSVVLHLLPTLDGFGALDYDLFAGCSLVDDALPVRLAAARRVDPFAIDTLMHHDHIARLRQSCRRRNGSQRHRDVALVQVVASYRNMILSGRNHRYGYCQQNDNHVFLHWFTPFT